MMSSTGTAPVSVVIPCYQCSATIGRAFASISQQTVKPAEIILIDDASEDGTLAVLQKIAELHHGWVKILQFKTNRGAASARNAGWEAACQPYIAFLDADDAWHPRKIEIQYEYMAGHPEVTLSGHHHRVVKQPEKMPDWEIGSWQACQLSRKALLMSNRLITPSVMLRRELPNRFLDGRRHIDDHLLWLELICDGHMLVKLPVELVSVYKHLFGVGGLSSQLWLMEQSELENYALLYGKGCINLVEWLCLVPYSLLKYVRRLLIYWLYLRWKI
jgi:glycosyltransferase involved in cell wall biosynthesis